MGMGVCVWAVWMGCMLDASSTALCAPNSDHTWGGRIPSPPFKERSSRLPSVRRFTPAPPLPARAPFKLGRAGPRACTRTHQVSRETSAAERWAPESSPFALASLSSRNAPAMPAYCEDAREHARNKASAAGAST
eukprot:scaffold16803_cov122-Isochrysis_galbana.AAC.2